MEFGSRQGRGQLAPVRSLFTQLGSQRHLRKRIAPIGLQTATVVQSLAVLISLGPFDDWSNSSVATGLRTVWLSIGQAQFWPFNSID